MGGYSSPLTCCDRDCAGANHCQIGGYQCNDCGRWFCGSELNEEGYCSDCAAEREEHTCTECGSYDSEQELFDGLCWDCLCASNPVKAVRVKAKEMHDFAARLRKVNLGFGTSAECHANDIDKIAEGLHDILKGAVKTLNDLACNLASDDAIVELANGK